MLDAIRRFFDERILAETSAGEKDSEEHGQRLATAALLIEMTRADFAVADEERQAVVDVVRRVYGLNGEDTRELVKLAEQEASDATSLYQFTGLINRHFSPRQKQHVVELLWEVAYADGRLDKYEEHLVRKVADLIHVSHSTFIRAKHRTREKLGI